MKTSENQKFNIDDYSAKRLNNICAFYGLVIGSFFIDDPVKVVNGMLASLQIRSMTVSDSYKDQIQIDISILKGLLYDLSR